MLRLLMLLALLALPAFAQTLVEITTVVAIQSTLDANVKFPSGSYKAGKGSDQIIARMGDGAKYNLEVYAAKGVAARLQEGFIQQVLTGFAVAGYFAESPKQKTINGETQTRYDLKDDSGNTAVLFVVRKGDELVYAFGKAK